MEPRALELRNFLSYTEASVDLSQVRLAALVGPNGAGKSSLLDAITFALFGEGTRGGARDLDRYVRQGEMEARVALTFALGGQEYRVIRQRSLGRGKSALEFYRRRGDEWEPIGGKTLQETQAEIERVLRMDYRTFTASSLILQGRSDSLTADMTDQERKGVLARILGLDIWDRIQEAAKERARAATSRLEQIRSRLQPLEAEAARAPELQSTIGALETELFAAEDRWKRLLERAEQFQARQAEAAAQKQRITDLRRRRDELQQEGARITERRRRLEEIVRQNAALLQRGDEIEVAAASIPDLEEALAAHDAGARAAQEAERSAAEIGERLARAEKRVESEIARLEALIAAAERQGSLLRGVPCAGTDLQARCQLLAGARRAVQEAEQARQRLTALHADPEVERLGREFTEAVDRKTAALQAYDRQAHEEVRANLEGARKVAALLPALKAATERTCEAEAELSAMQERSDTLRSELVAIERELSELTAQIMDADELPRLIWDAKSEAAACEVAANRAREDLARARADLERSEAAGRELGSLRPQMEGAQAEASTYQILAEAASKRGGVPALILENAVPQIEILANEMLARTTGGRLSIRLDTQAETKSGTMAEVLRITVLDGGQERPYQTYSGAERFLVDLALRLALSKFLAHRAGAEIGLLVLDEGLGALDASNREQVMAAIEAAASEFRQVLLITHIAELQDALPQRIEVSRGADGSRLQVVA